MVSVQGMVVVVAGMVSVKGMVVVVAGMVSVKGMVVVVVAGMVSVKDVSRPTTLDSGGLTLLQSLKSSLTNRSTPHITINCSTYKLLTFPANAPHFKTPPSYFSPSDRHKHQPTPNSSSFTPQTLLSLRLPVPPYNLSRREGAPGTQRYL
ncbi:hypothetical protein Pcinc_011681 [Petrolisthes cinctipes]|uniref:Uncharacterized protein n=1 Tax=Petrolisthes cinctipes TaxID=88211 RepID=A0AAE1G359_PETCI|nr:hypothetical protein Pcinc_011681 [Petrolisthes cinctipes]